MSTIPFLSLKLPAASTYLPLLNEMDESGSYSNYGPLNTRFENRMLAERFSSIGAALTVSNATAGLALAMRQVARPGARYAVMPSFTFAATPLAAQWAGLEPYFIDVDPATWLPSLEQVNAAVDRLGEEAAVVVPYATFGNPMDLAGYASLVKQGVPVVVDAAPGLGSKRDGHHFGVGFPGVVVFSMHCTKPFGIGEGGLLYSGDDGLIAALRTGGNFGFNQDRAAESIGFNTKLPEVLAAIALAQHDQFDEQQAERALVYEYYLEALKCHDARGAWRKQTLVGDATHQFFPILSPEGVSGNAVVGMLAAHGIHARRYFSPACHLQPAFFTCGRSSMLVTEALEERIVSLPLWVGLGEGDVDRIVRMLCS